MIANNIFCSRKAFLSRRNSSSRKHLSLFDQSRPAFRHPTTRGPGLDHGDRRYLFLDVTIALQSSSDSSSEETISRLDRNRKCYDAYMYVSCMAANRRYKTSYLKSESYRHCLLILFVKTLIHEMIMINIMMYVNVVMDVVRH